eukprot:scaffold130403_cov72-Phaeocystis_antarctica.AAC.2
MRVLLVHACSKRTAKPTSPPSCAPHSCATLRAAAMAATRRGCVMQIGPKPSSASICGSCVVLPHPVSPSTIITGLERSSFRICSRYAWIGSVGVSDAMAASDILPRRRGYNREPYVKIKLTRKHTYACPRSSPFAATIEYAQKLWRRRSFRLVRPPAAPAQAASRMRNPRTLPPPPPP